MNEASVQALARRAGITVEWRDYADAPQYVSASSLQRILAALGLPCDTPDELAHSERVLLADTLPTLITALAGEPIDLPLPTDLTPRSLQVTYEDGSVAQHAARAGARGVQLAAIERLGYHTVALGGQRIGIAVAPPRCIAVETLTGGKPGWGLTAQIYALRSDGDCGIGDTRGVLALAEGAAKDKADALGLSPVHALFTADPNHFSPYSPSSRLFYNPLHADARILFDDARYARAMAAAGTEGAAEEIEQSNLIDWPRFATIKMGVLRELFDDFRTTELAAAHPPPLAAAFAEFCKAGGEALLRHARFEALHAHKIKNEHAAWNWRDWEASWRDPDSEQVKAFAAANKDEIAFHCFLQWITERSLHAAQRGAKQAGMGIGLIADLAIGMSGAGSHAWSSPDNVLGGLDIGAPPDLYNSHGQNWGLTTFSPRALIARGFVPFLATLRASLKHAGGLRIDHVMGLLRLWMVPQGAHPREGAYLTYPFEDLLRLIALESHRHRAIIVGEDLGTVPAGFRERIARAGIYGMRVLLFERKGSQFMPPQQWPADTVAMTTTHDLPTMTGWWRGADIDTRDKIGLIADKAVEQTTRDKERRMLWRAFRRSNSASGKAPAQTEPLPVADAAARFIVQTPSALALLPLEDALALDEQTNIPGTVNEYPNWRRRYPGRALDLLAGPDVKRRLAPLAARGRR